MMTSETQMDGPTEWVMEARTYFVGNDLSGVVFVRDYIQLQFNPPPLVNALTAVTVILNGVTATQGAVEFANLLIGQINKVVKDVEVFEKECLIFRFEDGSEIKLSLKPEDYPGPEAVVLFLPNDSTVGDVVL
jgi:hypothetical protein